MSGISTEIGASVAAEATRARADALEVRKPKACMEALEMMAWGARKSEIAEKTGLTYSAMANLRIRHGDAIAVRRERAASEAEELADTYREVLREKAERLLSNPEQLDKLNPKDAALTLGILTDKEMTLRGDATAVVEHRRGVSLEDAQQMILQAQKRIRGEAIDVD